MKIKSILLMIIALTLILGCCTQIKNIEEKNEREKTGLCYRRDIQEDELGFFNHSPSKEEILDRLGYPNGSIALYENGVLYEYLYDYNVGAKPLTIAFNTDYSFKYVYSQATIDISGMEDVKEYDKTKYYREIRYDIKEEELSFIKKGIDSDDVQTLLGAPHAYLYGMMKNRRYAPDVVSNIFMYKLEDGKILYFRYSNYGKVTVAGYLDNDFNYTDIILEITP